MRKGSIVLGVAAAALFAGSSAVRAEDHGTQTSSSTPSSTTTQSSSTTQSSMSQSKELSGQLKSVDKDKRSLSIADSSGGQKDVKLSSSATITRDGTTSSLDQLKPGDQVRASFDPSTNEATSITVQSKSQSK